MGNALSPVSILFRGIDVKKSLFFLPLIVLLALPLACDTRAFNQPVSPLVAPTPTPTPAVSYQNSVPVPTATP